MDPAYPHRSWSSHAPLKAAFNDEQGRGNLGLALKSLLLARHPNEDQEVVRADTSLSLDESSARTSADWSARPEGWTGSPTVRGEGRQEGSWEEGGEGPVPSSSSRNEGLRSPGSALRRHFECPLLLRRVKEAGGLGKKSTHVHGEEWKSVLLPCFLHSLIWVFYFWYFENKIQNPPHFKTMYFDMYNGCKTGKGHFHRIHTFTFLICLFLKTSLLDLFLPQALNPG